MNHCDTWWSYGITFETGGSHDDFDPPARHQPIAAASTRLDIPTRRSASDLRVAVHVRPALCGHRHTALVEWYDARRGTGQRRRRVSSARRARAAAASTGLDGRGIRATV